MKKTNSNLMGVLLAACLISPTVYAFDLKGALEAVKKSAEQPKGGHTQAAEVKQESATPIKIEQKSENPLDSSVQPITNYTGFYKGKADPEFPKELPTELKITQEGKNVEFDAEGAWRDNRGGVSGKFILNSDSTATWKDPEIECVLDFKFKNGEIDVKQDGSCGMGLNVQVSNKYFRSTDKPVLIGEFDGDFKVAPTPQVSTKTSKSATTTSIDKSKSSNKVNEKLLQKVTSDFNGDSKPDEIKLVKVGTALKVFGIINGKEYLIEENKFESEKDLNTFNTIQGAKIELVKKGYQYTDEKGKQKKLPLNGVSVMIGVESNNFYIFKDNKFSLVQMESGEG